MSIKVQVNSDGKVYVDSNNKALVYDDPALSTLNVNPSTSSQVITAEQGEGFDTVNVSAVDSTIDSNITPENIKSGVSILGVTGSLEDKELVDDFPVTFGANTVLPHNVDFTVYPQYAGAQSSTFYPPENLIADNIKKGVKILGVEGNYDGEYVTASNCTRAAITAGSRVFLRHIEYGGTHYYTAESFLQIRYSADQLDLITGIALADVSDDWNESFVVKLLPDVGAVSSDIFTINRNVAHIGLPTPDITTIFTPANNYQYALRPVGSTLSTVHQLNLQFKITSTGSTIDKETVIMELSTGTYATHSMPDYRLRAKCTAEGYYQLYLDYGNSSYSKSTLDLGNYQVSGDWINFRIEFNYGDFTVFLNNNQIANASDKHYPYYIGLHYGIMNYCASEVQQSPFEVSFMLNQGANVTQVHDNGFSNNMVVTEFGFIDITKNGI